MPLTVDIAFADRNWKRRLPAIEKLTPKILKAALAYVNWPAAARTEISVVYSNDNDVHVLNRDWRGKDKPTNILSFPQLESYNPASGQPAHLGDLVLAYQTLSREAKEQGKDFTAHLVHLLVHGLLHLLGYDHETSRDAVKMEKLEVQILAKLGYTDPYHD